MPLLPLPHPLKEVIAYNYVSLVALLTRMVDEETLHQHAASSVVLTTISHLYVDGITAECSQIE